MDRRGLKRSAVNDIASVNEIQLLDIKPDTNKFINVIIAVKQLGISILKDKLDDVSNPHSTQYGHYLTKDNINNITRNKISKEKILDYLHKERDIHIISMTLDDSYITIKSSIITLERLFQTKFKIFRIQSKEYIRAHSYVIPHELIDHIHAVFNLVDIPLYVDKTSINSDKTSINSNKMGSVPFAGSVTPELIRNTYSINSSIVGNMNITQSVYAELNQSYSPSDLLQFQDLFGLQKTTFSSPYGHAINISCEFNNCGEANLDVQTILSVASNCSSIFYYNEDDSFLSYVVTLANLTESMIPDVTTISYAQYEDHLTQEFVDSFNTEMIKLGLMGKTIVSSSGDDGVGGFTARYNFAYCAYRPYFPGSCPYVLVVGGTQGPESGKPEITCQSNKGADITSGGGFSNKNNRPYYQNEVVLQYLSKVSPLPGFNRNGRVYPDVSAMSFNFTGVYGGSISFQSGTSASAPLVAGMISLLNSERQSKGMPLVGFINPLLYKYYSQFAIDITEGFNNCAAKGFVCCQQGFEAAVGFDAATGLGSINFENLTAIVMNVSSLQLPTTLPTIAPPPSYKPTSFPTSTSSVKMAMFHYFDGYGCGNSSAINHVTGVIAGR